MSTLILLPNLLDEEGSHELLGQSVKDAVASLHGLIAESHKGGRRFLAAFGKRDLPLQLLNEHTQEKEIPSLLEPILQNQRWGLISDAGLSCLADPGAKLVLTARQKGVSIEAIFGPSSIFLALLLSGLPAQNFAFHGYLEKDSALLVKQLQKLQKRSFEEKSTQIFIEAPYRNEKLLEQLLKNLSDDALLCVACDLTMPTQEVKTMRVREWKAKSFPQLDKRPAVFLFHK